VAGAFAVEAAACSVYPPRRAKDSQGPQARIWIHTCREDMRPCRKIERASISRLQIKKH